MKTFSFLKTLKDAPKPEEHICEETDNKYQTYRIETMNETKTIAVPLAMVEEFDKFVEGLGDNLEEVVKHLNKFSAVVI